MIAFAVTILNEASDVWPTALIAASAAILAGFTTGGVALLGINAQTKRLREEQQETERRLRRGAYRELLVALVRQTEFARARQPSNEEFEKLFSEYHAAIQGVHLEEADGVRSELEEVMLLNREIGEAMGIPEQDKPLVEQWRPFFEERADEIHAARGRLQWAMRKDISPGWMRNY